MILSICTQLTARQHACTSNCPFKFPSMLSVDQAETNGDLLSKLPLVISIVYGSAGIQLADEYNEPDCFTIIRRMHAIQPCHDAGLIVMA